MPRGARATTQGQLSANQAKDKFLEGVAKGLTNKEALALTGRTSEKTIEYWRSTDEAFKAKMDAARAIARSEAPDRDSLKQMGFAEFSEKYLGHKPHWHHLQWIDVLEGREPRDLHPAETYEKNNPNRILINCPPHHAKTATITINYVTYRICMDPNVRIKLVSKSASKAYEFLHAIKHYMTSPEFAELQRDFGPEGGWRETATRWTNNLVYLERSSGEKDPTLEALGIGGQLYGARTNLMILDDCVDTENAHQWESQLRWINRIVKSRLGRTGKLLVVGTRIAPIDLYRELRNGDHYSNGKSPYTRFAQPAVLEYAEDPVDWKTLWPKSESPIEEGSDVEAPGEDGMYAAWDGPALSSVRDETPATDWAMVYMQQDAEEEAAFPEHAVRGSISGMRRQGPLVAGAPGHPVRGMDGLHVIGSLDPSGSGQSAFLSYAVNRETKKRFVLKAQTMTPWQWPKVRQLVKDWTEELGIREWIVEKNMYHASFRHDEDLTAWLQNRGVLVREHFTGSGKLDVALGVTALSTLFGQWEQDPETHKWRCIVEPLVDLPSTYKGDGIAQLVEQLVTWAPDTKNKTDLVMALWFAELRAREIAKSNNKFSKSHMANKYLTEGRKRQQRVISLHDFRNTA